MCATAVDWYILLFVTLSSVSVKISVLESGKKAYCCGLRDYSRTQYISWWCQCDCVNIINDHDTTDITTSRVCDLPVAFDEQQLMKRTVNRHSTQKDLANEQWVLSVVILILLLQSERCTWSGLLEAINGVFSQLNTPTIAYLMSITTPGWSREILFMELRPVIWIIMGRGSEPI